MTYILLFRIVTNVQKAIIEELAQGVLDARSKFPQSSLAALYDPLNMPPVLLKAYQALNKAVMKLYKFRKDMSEAEIVAELMGRYRELVENEER
jgi:predicted amidophosphoribosyltransferase